MNKNYRTIWNDALGAWVAVSEIETAKGKPAGSSYASARCDDNVVVSPNHKNDVANIRKIYNISGWSWGTLALNFALATGFTLLPASEAVAVTCHQYGGTAATSPDVTSFACGSGAKATGTNSVAIGNGAQATQGNATAFGSGAQATGVNSTAFGSVAKATGVNSTAFGYNANAGPNWGTAFGYNAAATGKNSPLAVGTETLSNGSSSVAIGDWATALGDRAIALGGQASGNHNPGGATYAAGTDSISIGTKAQTNAANAIAMGTNAQGNATNAVAIGLNTNAVNLNDVALGANSVSAAPHTGSYTLNSSYTAAATTPSSVVSVGAAGTERQIQNVAAGVISANSTDAINGSQLYATNNYLSNLATTTQGVLGGNATVSPNGTLSMSDIGGTGKNTVNDAIAAAKTEVEAGTNVSSVTSATGANGQTVYTVNADGAKASAGSNAVTVTAGVKDSNNVTDYAIDLSEASKASLAKADSALQSFTTSVNGTTAETIDQTNNQVNFVNGTGTTARNSSGDITFDVNKSGLTSAADGTVTADEPGDNFATAANVADAINKSSKAAKTEVVAGSNIEVDSETGNDGQTIYTVKTADSLTVESITADGTVLSSDGLTITPANGGNPVSLSENGLNNGGNVISGVANGVADDDAVNMAQLNAVSNAANAGWNLTAEGANSSNVGANETVDLNNSDNNIEISKTAGSNDVTFNLARNLTVDGVTAGSGDSQVVIGSNGVQVGGNTYINNDGLNANDKVVSNVAAGKDGNDAVNVSQLSPLATALGVNVDPNSGTVSSPSFVVTGTAGNQYAGATTIQGALDNIGTELQKPLTFSGDNAAGNFNRQLGSQVNLRGGATGALSNNNIGVVANGTDTLNIQLAKELTDLTSAQFTDAAGNSTTVGGNGINITPANGNPVSLSENGLNNGGNVISGVAEGQAGTDAVNVDQLNAVRDTASAGWNLTAQGQNSSNVGANETVDLNNSDNNIEISKTAGSNDVTFNLARNLTVDGVTAGTGDSQVVIGSNGVQVGGNTYINNDGLNANDKVVSNVAAGNISANSTDAVNGSQLFQAGANTAQYLGGGSTVDGNGNVTAPSYTLTSGNPADGSTTAYNNVGDALGALNTAVNQPLTFSGDNAAGNFNRQLGSQVNLRGGATGELSDNNIGVVANGTDTLNIQLAKELTDLTSAQFVDAAGNRTTVDSNGINITPANGTPVSLSENGLNNGGNVIAGVGAGQAGTDAVNVDQLNAAAAAATNKVAAGDNIEVAEVQNNDGSTTYTVATARNVNFDRVTAGSGDNQVVLNNSGVNVGGNTYISNDGLNANNRVIRNVAAGNVAAGSTDAVNGGQLHNTANSIANVFGGNAAVNPDGSVSMSNVGGTGANNVNDAIRAVNQAAVQAKTTVTAGDNIVVTPSTNADGSSNYTVATAKDLAVDSVTAGNTVINNGGITINNGAAGNPVSLGQNGLNNGGNTLTNVASGLQGKTVDQIRAEGSNSAQWNNAATVGDLTQVQGNVTNVNNTITNLSTTVGGADDNGNAYLSPNGELTDAGRLALKTYDVQGQTATDNNTVISAIKNMNEGGIKYFHTNDASGQKTGGAIADTHDSSASGAYATAIGYSATANAENAIALGRGAQALAENSISIGTGNIVRGNKSGAIGDPTIINGESSYSVGNDNRVDTNDTFVLGNNVTQTMNNSVILGSQSSATAVHTTAGGGNYTYAGANDDNVAGVNDVVGVVSVGTEGQTRQVQNVAAGVVSPTSTDAINGSQLYYTNQAINNNVVNIGNQLNKRIDNVEADAKAGAAAAMAVAGLPQAYLPGKNMMAIAGSTYRGAQGYAVGYSGISDNGNWIIKGTASGNSRGQYGATAGIGYQW